jgi:hypothetical protein
MAMLGNPISIMDFPVDYFTGDGTSTTFQLSRIPASATSILVHIGGVKQVASTTDPAYYLDGSKLVFVSPPGAYSPIEVNYLGIAGQVNIPGVQSVTQDMLSLQLANTFVYQTTANGATASFTLNAPPVSANSLVVSANGVIQHDYSVNSNTLTFGFTPPSGTFIRITSLALAQAGVPTDGSVTSVKLGANLTLTGNTTFDGFSGNPARIRGDMSNATVANRLFFQNSASATTWLGVIPGTGSTQSQVAVYNNADPTNAAYLRSLITSAETRIDSNITGTGTYLPLTMYTGGSERMRIANTGTVSVGTTASYGKITLQGGANNATDLATSQSTSTLYIQPKNTSGYGLVVGSGPSDFPYIQNVTINGGASGDLLIQPFGGNLGIGTSSPVEKLTVSGSISTNTDLVLKEGTTARGYIFGTSAGLTYRATSGLPHIFQNVGTELMRLDSTGRLLVGTTSTFSQSAGSVISAVGAGSNFVCEKSSGGSIAFYQSGVVTGLIEDVSSQGGLRFYTGTSGSVAERMRIDSAGNVGIGTSSPNATFRLDVVGNAGVRIQGGTTGKIDLRSASGNAVFIGMTEAGVADRGVIGFPAGSGDMQFRNNGAYDFSTGNERMRIDSSGRVTTPAQPAFDAYGTVGNVLFTTDIPIPLNSTTYNVGNHYNTSTYRFTAPVAGIYFFRAQVYKQASGNASRLRLYKNAADVRVYQYSDATGTFTHNITGIISLAVGDYVTCNFNSDGAGTNIYLADNHTNFSGYLLG